jgi:hypothetical protein
MARYKPRRQARYKELIRRHFIHEEAVVLSTLQSLRYAEVAKMTGSRQLLYNRFRKLAEAAGVRPDDPRFTRRYRKYVRKWYVDHNLDTFDTNMKRVLSPWTWIDRVSYRLPEELRYLKDGRRLDKVVSPDGEREKPSKHAERLRWIQQLKETLSAHPDRAPQLIPQIMNLGGKVSPSWKRRAGLK